MKVSSTHHEVQYSNTSLAPSSPSRRGRPETHRRAASGTTVTTPPQAPIDLPGSPSAASIRYNLRQRSPASSPRAKQTIVHIRNIEPHLWERAAEVVDRMRGRDNIRLWPSFAEGEIIDYVEHARLTLSASQILRPAFCSHLRPQRKITTFAPGKIATILDDIIHQRPLMPLKIENMNLVYDGNHRLAVLRELGFEQVWIVESNTVGQC